MRRTDDVYFFTLIDFLIQVFFFGLLIYVVGQGAAADESEKNSAEGKKIEKVVSWTGFSSLTELTEFLSKLAPPENFRGWADFMSNHKKEIRPAEFVAGEEAKEFVEKNGGKAEVERKLELYAKAFGLPPCESNLVGGKLVPLSVGTMRLENDKITLIHTTIELNQALSDAEVALAPGEGISLSEFRNRLATLRLRKPDCRHFVDIEVRSALLAPMDSLQSVFRIASRR